MTTPLNHPLISQRYFFPRAEAPEQPFWVECNDGIRLACAYYETNPQAPTLVHFHGNGEVVADYLDGFPGLIGRMGCNCFFAEFRGYGGSTGSPQLGKMLDDVVPTIEALDRPANKIILFGRSVGSLFAVKAAGHFPDIAGLILESAIADPVERLLLRVDPGELGTTHTGLVAAITAAVDIRGVMSRFARPVLIMHTRHDGLIDASHAERLADWCAGPARLKIFPHGNHNSIMSVNGPEYFGLMKNFLLSLRG
jgi:pimeloyl-ACP methyl ester carboxylesterase